MCFLNLNTQQTKFNKIYLSQNRNTKSIWSLYKNTKKDQVVSHSNNLLQSHHHIYLMLERIMILKQIELCLHNHQLKVIQQIHWSHIERMLVMTTQEDNSIMKFKNVPLLLKYDNQHLDKAQLNQSQDQWLEQLIALLTGRAQKIF